MANKKVRGTVGKGGVNPAPIPDNHTVRVAAEQLVLVPIDDLVPYANNAKVHTPEQINQIRGSLREFGFVTPVLIDFENNIIAGHGRVMAARAEGMTEVPCVMVSNLTDTQRKAYILADNRMSEIAQWDLKTLEIELEGLQELQFDLDVIGFDVESVDNLFAESDKEEDGGNDQSLAEDDDYDGSVPEVCTHKPGDVFRLGRHLLVCGDCASPNCVQPYVGGGTGGSSSH